MVAALLDAGGLDPTVVNGGIINAYGTNAKVGAGRLDRGRGRRERRQLPAAAGRPWPWSPTSTPSTWTTTASFDAVREGLPRLRREHPVLRFRRGLHRPSRGPGPDRPRRPTGGWSPTASTRRPTSAPCRRRPGRRRAVRRRRSAPATARASVGWSGCTCRWPGRHNVAERAGRRSPSPASSASPTTCVRRSAGRASRASSGASPPPARSTASASSTTTATIRSRSPPCCRPPRARRRGPGDRGGAAASLHAACATCSTSSAPASTTPTR